MGKHHLIRPETSPAINLTQVNMRCFIRHFVEPHAVQIQTARFWQHLQTTTAAPAQQQQVQLDPVKRWKSTKSPVWCQYSPLVSILWLLQQRLIRAMFRPVAAAVAFPLSPPPLIPAVVGGRPRLRLRRKKRRKKRSLSRRRILTVKVTLPVTVGIQVTTTMASEAPPCVEVASL